MAAVCPALRTSVTTRTRGSDARRSLSRAGEASVLPSSTRTISKGRDRDSSTGTISRCSGAMLSCSLNTGTTTEIAGPATDMLGFTPHHRGTFSGVDVSALYPVNSTARPAGRAFLLVALVLLACVAVQPACGNARRERPHVLLVVMSGARPDHMSAYGYAKPTTPTLVNLAAEGTLFENAVTSAPWSLSAQASLASGLFPTEHGAVFEHPVLEARIQTLAETLKTAGYDTFGVTTDDQLGQANGFGQGYDVYKELRPVEKGLPDEGGAAAEAALLEWLASRPDKDRPFFASVTLINPRLPFNPQGEFQQKFIPTPIPLPRLEQLTQLWIPFARQFTLDMVTLRPEEMAALVGLYDGEIAYADYRLGRIVEALRKDALLDDTLVVVTGDAGEDLGDHGAIADVSNVWDTLVRVPLVMRLPERVAAGARETGQVQIVDVMDAVVRLTAPPSGTPGAPAAPPMRPRPTAIVEARFDPAAIRYYESVMPASEAAIFR